MYSLLAAPLVLDAGLLRGARDGDAGEALRTSTAYAQAVAASLTLTSLTKGLARRERPVTRACRPVVTDAAECARTDFDESFVSGHAAAAFTGAAFICLEHTRRAGFGARAADRATCAAALTLAGTTGLLRVVADAHYTSDVLAGALVGVLSGYVVPQLLQPAVRAPEPGAVAVPQLRAAPPVFTVSLQF
jgi:membrane-associated phospholipid phosphatase